MGVCRAISPENDNGGNLLDWPKDDRIRWVEWEIRRIVFGEPTPGSPGRIDLEIWLSKERDGLSWYQIGLKFCGSKTSASVSKVRRAFERVQRFNPGVEKEPRQKPGPKPKSKM